MRRVAFTDLADPRVAAAMRELAGEGVAGVPVDATTRGHGDVVERVARRRGIEREIAERLLARPVPAALAMLAAGEVDAVVAGAGDHTNHVLLACELVLGVATDGAIPSSLFVLDAASRGRFVVADCAVNPSPSAEALARIAVQAGDAAERLLGAAPRVAMLSFSTHGSASHPDVEKVQRATALARELRPAMAIDGELQADAALDAVAATRKSAGELGGQANVLVFPDLDAANIGYKLVRALAGARAYGALLQGYGSPHVAKISRGATAEEIAGTTRALIR